MEQLSSEPGQPAAVVAIASVIAALALPFLMVTENPLTLLIFGFGLSQVWTMNRRRVLAISGPHTVAPALCRADTRRPRPLLGRLRERDGGGALPGLRTPRARRAASAARRRCERAEAAGDTTLAGTMWRPALATTRRRLSAASGHPGAAGGASREASHGAKSGWGSGRALAGAGALALLTRKLKFVLVFLHTEAKLLLLGFTKLSTFSGMLLSVGVYRGVYGWPFAAGMVLSI